LNMRENRAVYQNAHYGHANTDTLAFDPRETSFRIDRLTVVRGPSPLTKMIRRRC